MTELPLRLVGEAGGTVLVVAPREGLAKRVENTLRNGGHPVHALWAANLANLEKILASNPPDLVMCDMDVAEAPREAVLALCAQHLADLPVILLTGEYSRDQAVAALAAGFTDFCAHDDAGALRHLELVVMRELTKHRQIRELRESQKAFADFKARHQHLVAATADAMATVHEGILANVNLAFARLLGYSEPQDLIDHPLIDLIAVEQRLRVKEQLRQILKGKAPGTPLQLEFIGRHRKVIAVAELLLAHDNGESVIEILIRPEDGGAQGETATIGADLRHRSRFAEAMKIKSPDASRAALLVRIDGFEALEQRLGHVQAIKLRTQVVRAIHARLSPADEAFAFSLEEQGLLIERPSHAEIEAFGHSLLKEIGAETMRTDLHEAHVTLSMAIHPLHEDDVADLVISKLVDGVRKASAKGGNRSVVLSSNRAQAQQNDQDLALRVQLVKRALEFNRLKIAYQSIASLEGDERRLFEVLIRLVDDNGKEWQAADFVPAAAQARLMQFVDRWIVKRMLAAVAKRGASAEPALFFIKLSEETLVNADGFLEWIRNELGGRKIAPGILFQMQEILIQDHVEKIGRLSAGLRELGSEISLDHFGIGSASARLLSHVPASFVKFHSSFTQDFAEPDVQKKLGELVETAKHLGVKTIVSHVEDAHVMARLWQMGVNFVQGFHVQEPEVVQLASTVGAAAA